MQIEEVSGAKALEEPNLFELANPPKSHPDIESVVIVAYPRTGICTIRGIGRNLDGDGAGISIRTKVDALAEALGSKYGKGEKHDGCAGGDVACEAQFWMMTLSGGERVYAYEWNTQNENMKKNGLGQIFAAAQAADIQTTYPVLEFHSASKAACDAASKESSASAL